MQCQKCGAQVDPFAGFCENCGTEIPKEAAQLEVKARVTDFCKKAFAFVKKHWLWFAIGLTVFVSGIIILSIVSKPKVINLSEYLIYTSSGHEGYGQLTISVDSEELAKDILGKKPKDDDKYNEYADAVESFEAAITLNYNNDSIYKNGDIVKIEVSAKTPEIFTQKNCKWEKDEFTIRVIIGEDTEPLGELKAINLWDYLDSTVTGHEGFASVDYKIRYEDLCVTLYGEMPDAAESYYDYEQWMNHLKNIKSNISVSSEASSSLKTGDSYAVKFYVSNLKAYQDLGYAIVERDLGKLHTVGTDTKAPTAITKVDLIQYIPYGYSYNNYWKYYSLAYHEETQTIDAVATDGTPYTVSLTYYYGSYTYVTFDIASSLVPDKSVRIKFSVSSTGNTSEVKIGDQITFTWDKSEELAKKLGITLLEETRTITVTDLNK